MIIQGIIFTVPGFWILEYQLVFKGQIFHELAYSNFSRRDKSLRTLLKLVINAFSKHFKGKISRMAIK